MRWSERPDGTNARLRRKASRPRSPNRFERLEQWRELSQTAEAFALYDNAGKLLLWNNGYLRVLGLEAGTLRRGLHWDALAAAGAPGHAPERRLFATTERKPIRETQVWTAGGGWYRTHVERFSSRRTAISHVDITALMLKEEELITLQDELRHARDLAQAASEAKSRFLANMSHELRTPLNSVIGFSEVMVQDHLRGRVDPERHQFYAKLILDSGQHLLGIVDDMLDLVRVEEGRVRLSESDSDLVELARSAARIAFGRSGDKPVTLIESVPEAPMLAHIDARLIRQAILNLIGNAIKFSHPNGRVWLSVKRSAHGEAEVEVRDEGIGIPPDKLVEVLEPFAQVETSEARQYGGIGLGLPLARQFAELHGGTLSLESGGGQAGTTARLAIPADRLPPMAG